MEQSQNKELQAALEKLKNYFLNKQPLSLYQGEMLVKIIEKAIKEQEFDFDWLLEKDLEKLEIAKDSLGNIHFVISKKGYMTLKKKLKAFEIFKELLNVWEGELPFGEQTREVIINEIKKWLDKRLSQEDKDLLKEVLR